MSADVHAPPARSREGSGLFRLAENLGRAFAGALIFALPLLMTMEMWSLGMYLDRGRLFLLLLLSIPLLVALSYHSGFEETFDIREDARDAFAALAIGALTSALILWLFGLLTADMTLDEIVGKIALQTIPAGMGALLARSQLARREEDEEREERGGKEDTYWGELFLMAVGALFLSLNIAPTEEMILIAYKMSPERCIVLAILSIAVMHAFIYAVNFRGESERPEGHSFWKLLLKDSVAGYAMVLLVSLYVLWTFGRLDGVSVEEALSAAIVLGFPGAVGAAGARLIL